MNKFLCTMLVLSLLFSSTSSTTVNAMQRNADVATTNTTWIELGTSECPASVKATVGGLLFTGISLILPYGAIAGSALVSSSISIAGMLATGKVVSTQYYESGPINASTRIKTVTKYYEASGNYILVSTSTSYTTLGQIWNVYSLPQGESI